MYPFYATSPDDELKCDGDYALIPYVCFGFVRMPMFVGNVLPFNTIFNIWV